MKRLLFLLVVPVIIFSCRHQKAATTSTNTDTNIYTSQTTNTTSTIQNTNDTTVTTTVVTASTTTNVSANNDTVVTTVSAGGNPNPAVDSSSIYRITIQFISKGEGIDSQTAEDFEKWLNDYPKHPAYDKTQWGREGETNYCLKLHELSTREQDIFVRDVRTKLADKQLVIVNEYAECKGRKVN
ncbi:MAG: hypothetical protein HY064_12495 [Bacteroidetes bacterium]|nr:hypothetical protein [Bacteroidota bacterium]